MYRSAPLRGARHHAPERMTTRKEKTVNFLPFPEDMQKDYANDTRARYEAGKGKRRLYVASTCRELGEFSAKEAWEGLRNGFLISRP
tara:strand:+ start:594 stop:854 length:261 start_codon:yes stop_codon:yes gene_type:complete